MACVARRADTEERLLNAWVSLLPYGTILRHHVKGDIMMIDRDVLDRVYLAHMRKAVPPGGAAFTFTHYDGFIHCRPSGRKETVINMSCESHKRAHQIMRAGHNAAIVIPHAGVLEQASDIVLCPAETGTATCATNCGGSDGPPLCAIRNRKYPIGFFPKGPQRRAIVARLEKLWR